MKDRLLKAAVSLLTAATVACYGGSASAVVGAEPPVPPGTAGIMGRIPDMNQERLARLDYNFGHLSLRGRLDLTSSLHHGDLPKPAGSGENPYGDHQQLGEGTRPSIKGQLELNLNANINNHLSVYADLLAGSTFGVQFASDLPFGDSYTPPIVRLGEFGASYSSGRFSLTAGLQRFTLGPVGLAARSTMVPVHLMAVGYEADTMSVALLGGRLSSEYYVGTDYVVGTDTLMGGRVETRVGGSTIIGYNHLLSGLGDEMAQSFDLTTRIADRRLVAEAARYNHGSTITDMAHQDAYALFLRFNLIDTADQILRVGYGVAEKGFTPAFSATATSTGASLNLAHNSSNLTVDYMRRLSGPYSLSGSVSVSEFIDPQFAADTQMARHLPSSEYTIGVQKELERNSLLSLTLSHRQSSEFSYNSVTAQMSFGF